MTATGRAAVSDHSTAADRRRLVVLSFLTLFLELALIRWLGANVVYLGFFSNLILLGSFLGIGVGFLGVGRARAWINALPWSLLALVGLVLLFPIEIDRSTSDVLFFGNPEPNGLPIWAIVPILFALAVALMAMVGQEVARVFGRFGALEAYVYDISGSLLGIAGFTLVSFLRAPPLVWGLVVAVVVLTMVRSLNRAARIAMVGTVVLLAVQSFAPGLSWSPYYQVSVYEYDGWTNVAVNSIPHQVVYPARALESTIYDEPYRLLGEGWTGEVLIVGAGTGNDVAVALANGATKVDAVEIDPLLYELGIELHPDQPYNDPRVDVSIDDGRAFMQRGRRLYDLIIFALPDSLTLLSGQASLRLESYLFTTEAFEQARRILADDGMFVMYNFYRDDWLVGRLARTMQQVFGDHPCVTSIGGASRLALLAAGPPAWAQCTTPDWDVASAPAPATDDRPFLYVRDRTVPPFYLVTLGLILLVSTLATRVSVGRLRDLRPFADLFAMGGAFLLLETKSVVQFALWFGTTWVVNSLVFAGVLASVLAATALARSRRLPPATWLFLILFAALAVARAIPPGWLLDLSFPARVAAATVLGFTPVFIANLIFAQRFADTASSTAAFGANMLGAMVGGMIEYSALVIGHRNLLVAAAILYGAALWLRPARAPVSGA